ncbi:MAG: hypothetical protein Q8927_12590 [Bacteroidota bacterium]|nr:hypothetical protein [Bacteroidota bacterium]MDP4252499.1 hypothetical protein [Bacteroidota bacterium]
MALKIIQFLNLLAYGFVASQAMFYLLAMSKTQKSMRPASYTELRNLLDNNLQVTLRIVYYSTLLTSLVWFICTLPYSGFLLVSSSIALGSFLIDMVLLLTGDMPINKIIQTWSPETYPADWEAYRNRWFFYYHRRQLADLLGFASLLAGACFG